MLISTSKISEFLCRNRGDLPSSTRCPDAAVDLLLNYSDKLMVDGDGA